MRNANLNESQGGIKTARRNINNLRCALMIESEGELKSFLMKVKEESEKAGLKLNIHKMKIMASSPITFWQIEGEKVETQEAIVRTGHGTTDWFQIGKEYIKAVYCHPAYLTYMQNTS